MNTSRSQVAVAKAEGTPFGMVMWTCWAYILVAVGRVNELVPGLAAIPLAKIAVLLWAIALLTRRHSESYRLWQASFFRIAIALVVLACFSLLFSIWPGATLAFLRGPGAVLVITLFLFGKTLTSWRAVRATVLCFVVAGSGLAIQGMRSYGGGRLVVDSMYDPNDLAYVLVTVLPLVGAFAYAAKGWQRRFLIGSALLLLVVILLTQSRGAFLALAAMSFFLLRFIRSARSAAKSGGKPRKSLVPVIITGVAVCGALWMVLPNEARERITTVFSLSNDYNTDLDNNSGRVSIWKRNFAALVERPIGYGLSASAMVDLRHGGKFKAIHNTPLQLGVELGFLGLLLLICAHWVLWRDLRKLVVGKFLVPLSEEQQLVAYALRLSMIGNIVSGFFLSMAYSNLLWLLLALMAMTVMVLRAPLDTAGVVSRKRYGAA